ncbi:aminoglycoside phosphotransferase family protein [Streptomyces sp. M10(2022)]
MSLDRTAAVLRAVGVTEAEIAACVPLTGGTYNTITRVTLTDGRDWVVKIPPPHPPGLSYERDLLVNEVTFCTVAPAVGGATIPQIVHSELDTGAVAGAYLVMSLCPGKPWHELADGLSEGEERRLRGEFGRIVGRLHTVTGPAGFGYPAESVGPLAATWREAFTAMAGAVLADASRYAARLPRPVAEIRRLLENASYVLDDVTRPALVHFDLWQGNLLVDGAPGARRLSGIIDGERMFWGDPVADLVSTALFGDVEKDSDFLAGYAKGQAVRSSSPPPYGCGSRSTAAIST